MKIKIVADSSANLNALDRVDFTSAPLKIIAGEKEYTDVETLDVAGMLKDLREYKGKSSTACPGVGDWLEAFEGADEVYGVAITSNLSGCYNAAAIAAEEYMAAHPGTKVFILDSLSTGPEMELILEKYRELIEAGRHFEEICAEIQEYSKQTHLIFSLESLNNFARNGRINPAIAAAVGFLGIRIVGKASAEGTLEPMHKCRGEKKALQQLMTCMKEMGFQGGKVRLSHSYNAEAADQFAGMIREQYPDCEITIRLNRGLCCYYAEEGGLLVGFEG